MLLQRVITSFALLFVILGAVFGLSETLFSLFVGLVIAIAIWEWASLAGLDGVAGKSIYLFLILAMMFFIQQTGLPIVNYLLVSLVFWGTVFGLICIYPKGTGNWGSRPILMLAGIPLFIPGWLAFVFLRQQDYFAFHLLLVLALIAAADIGAYFSGKAFGRHKLAVRVSPNKTWEGFVGGLLGCCLLITLTAFTLISRVTEMNFMLWVKLLGCALVIAAVSVVGDLFESMIKRFRDVKDSGTILPGHGGILDRIDGITAATPVYALFLLMLEPDLL